MHPAFGLELPEGAGVPVHVQTVMRCWDALLSEGTKIVFRVSLALLKAHEGLLLDKDNAGYVLRQMKLAAAATHDRDGLMKVRCMCTSC